MQFHGHTAVVPSLLSACLNLCLSVYCQAKDWDLDRGQYSRDTEISGLAGPVQRIAERTFEGDQFVSLSTIHFDAQRNKTKSEYYDYRNMYCSETIHIYDSQGNRINEAYRNGTLVGADNCENLSLQWSWRYTYEFDRRGAVLVRQISNTIAAAQSVGEVWRYVYDSLDRLIRVDVSGSGLLVQRFESYSYSSDQRGLRVRRHHYSRWNDGNHTYDLVREALYAPDGRLEKVVQTPPGVMGFGGNETRTYSGAGYLIREQRIDFDYTVAYSQHDNYGNWTESMSSRRARVTRQIEY
jgi:YD repeat-containing protein